MASLSFLSSGGVFAGCANPIYPTGVIDWSEGAVLTFEMLERDAAWLKSHCGTNEIFAFSHHVFRGEIIAVESCETTIPALSLLAKPTMRATIKIHKVVSVDNSIA